MTLPQYDEEQSEEEWGEIGDPIWEDCWEEDDD